MPEIAEIFRDHHKEYFRRNNAPPEVIRTIFDIEKCCTPAMGHSILCTCPDCGHLEIRYRSCGNRNCPQCGGHKITEWVEKRLTERLPVDYFMATFTLPREFNFLFRQHPGEAVKTFMKCVSDSLLEMGKSKLHGMVGFMMVYQSWCRVVTVISIRIFTHYCHAERCRRTKRSGYFPNGEISCSQKFR